MLGDPVENKKYARILCGSRFHCYRSCITSSLSGRICFYITQLTYDYLVCAAKLGGSTHKSLPSTGCENHDIATVKVLPQTGYLNFLLT